MLELSINNPGKLRNVSHALSSEVRLKIIELLNIESMNVNQLSESLGIPVSTVASHIKVLEKAELIQTELRPAIRGAMKVCTRNFDDIHIRLNTPKSNVNMYDSYEIEMPIGQYTDFFVSPTCGIGNQEGIIIPEDEPVHFYSPKRTEAQLIWTRKGYFEYRFPLVIPHGAKVKSLQVSAEICSEAPNYDHNWPSDITVWLNGIDIGTWTSPGDFGDRPGKLNPKAWAETTRTQYGTLKTWKVTEEKVTIDDIYLSGITVNNLRILERDFLSFRIGIKEDADHKGGLNIFGSKLGDYSQDIILKLSFY